MWSRDCFDAWCVYDLELTTTVPAKYVMYISECDFFQGYLILWIVILCFYQPQENTYFKTYQRYTNDVICTHLAENTTIILRLQKRI